MAFWIIKLMVFLLYYTNWGSTKCVGDCKSVCPKPTSFGLPCTRYLDQCQSNRNCAAGQQCCLVAGCGKECMSVGDGTKGVFHPLPVCSAPTSFGLQCKRYFDHCQSNQNCAVGHQCCLIAGCGKECMRV